MKNKKQFFDNLYQEFYGKERGGWHVVIHTSPEEELSAVYMSLLLTDASVLNTRFPF